MTAWDDSSFRRNRRAFLGRSAGSLGLMALAHLLDQESGRGRVLAAGPEITKLPKARAKSVICLFQHGGPSQMDLFDPKPALARFDGKPYPGKLEIHFNTQAGNVLASPFRFAPRGESGMVLSELLPHTSAIADEITLVRSMTTESVDHEAALRLIHSGKILAGRPTLGSWVIYALGSENRDLPAYVVLSDPGGLPVDGVRNWSSGWLPAVYQGTPFRSGANPVLNLETPKTLTPEARGGQLRFLDALNQAHLARHVGDTELEARIANFETAARMQTAVPDALNLDSEPKAIRSMYGLDNEVTREYGTRCLIARRLIERGVRFVQLFLSGQPWDTHNKNAEMLKSLCARTDQPSAALVLDLRQRGLLDDTIVLWTGEFGRLPVSQGKDGRDHNRHGFSLWLAGGGFKRGYVHGATDDFGYSAVSDAVSVQDLQATILHTLGLDHRRLVFPHEGRDDSLTDHEVTHAKIVPALLA
ncbi:MAG: DUF1501 domain-containing protein [Paludisphaera borealis]|uniref:DUF1501 domain-containing protein n=1 Tax=Paludisphaera borealis TaxID=1387353 RepID=UPI00284C74A3|nr:DUF1501 domain-containing protein [Paludisphaera borealis]MDR3618374.1 DUF1501 domain-containing protein [Paludisphaera borealis]